MIKQELKTASRTHARLANRTRSITAESSIRLELGTWPISDASMPLDIFRRNESVDYIEQVLTARLPQTLPVLRRLQFMKIKGGRTANSLVLASFKGEVERCCVVAYLDFSRGPETEMWLYSSMEDGELTKAEEALCQEQIVALLSYARQIERDFDRPRETPGIVLIGSLHEKALKALQRRGMVEEATSPNIKFVFDTSKLPPAKPIPDHLQWTTIRVKDIPLVLSRTDIPRKE